MYNVDFLFFLVTLDSLNKPEILRVQVSGAQLGFYFTRLLLLCVLLQIVGPADGSNYIVDYYGARLTRLSITNQTYRKPHLSL